MNCSCIRLLRVPVAVPGSLKITKPQDEAPKRDATNLDMPFPRLRLLQAPFGIYIAHTSIPITKERILFNLSSDVTDGDGVICSWNRASGPCTKWARNYNMNPGFPSLSLFRGCAMPTIGCRGRGPDRKGTITPPKYHVR